MADSLASQIITAIGGPENVRSLTHCATRLRFELADASKVDQNALEHMKGVLGAVPQSGDRFQVVIGGGVHENKNSGRTEPVLSVGYVRPPKVGYSSPW